MNENSLGTLFQSHANNLNLLRLLAAFAVIYGHATAVTGNGPPDIFLQLVGYKFIGGVAVDIFFVISGFLITASAASGNGYRYYIASRALRIYPALLVCVALTTFILGPTVTSATKYWSDPRIWNYFFWNSSALKTEYFLPGVFESNFDRAVNGSLWSIVVEVRLYIAVGIAMLLGLFRHRSLFNALLLCTLTYSYLSPEFAALISPHENHRHVAMMFSLGAFAWVNRYDITISPTILLAMIMFAATQHGTKGFGFSYSLLLSYCVFTFAFLPGFNWFHKVDDYSYGIYLYGWPSQQITASAFPTFTNYENTLVASLIALVAAYFSWTLIEKPTLALRRKFRFIKGAP